MKIFSLILALLWCIPNPNLTKPKPMESQKNTYIVYVEFFCHMLLNLQGSHKFHCLKKKENIWGCKTYFATFFPHLTCILPNQVQNSFFSFVVVILFVSRT
jgi:hypothetical protein